MKHAPLLVVLSLISSTVANHCECGFSVNNTNAQSFGLFTELEETDFFHTASVDATARIGTTRWDAQAYNKTAEQVGRLIGFSKQLGNVVTNPLPEGKWGGPPQGVGDAGLQLWVRHAVENDLVSVAGVDDAYNPANTSQMIYGSFRAAIKFSAMNGTRGAFSWQSASEDRQQYIGLEFASSETETVKMEISVVKFPEEFHEYRFDWLPDRVDFYVDGLLMLTESECVPNTLGTLALRHFEDNGRDGPPAQDAVMTVGYVKAYYNATTRDEAKPGCKNLEGSVCIIPNQNIPPNPNGKKTHFYSQWLEDHKDDDPKPNDVGHGWDWDEENSAAVFSAGLLVASFLLILASGLL